MQSSAAVMFRALVMLACLVAIPLLAVFGKSLPEIINTLLDGGWPSRPTSALNCPDKAPQFDPMVAVDLSASHVAPASYEAPAHSQPDPTAATPTNPQRHAPPPVNQFTHIQDRLRQLGATYYLLESWGSRPQLYRFYCKVAISGNPNSTRYYFEATNSDPLHAMAQVLQQVESWRRARGKGRGARG